MKPPSTSGSCVALARIPATSEPAPGSDRQNAALVSPRAIPGRYLCFCSSVPPIMIGPVGSRVSNSMRPITFEYLVTSSMATVRPIMPAPDPPYSSGMHNPRRSALLISSKMSCGYAPVESIARAWGFTTFCASRRTLCCKSASSSVSSKSMCDAPRALLLLVLCLSEPF
jgi:hypothetical protein